MKPRVREPFFLGRRPLFETPPASLPSRADARSPLETDEDMQVSAPRYVRYEDATNRVYLVRALFNDHLIQVPKRYARAMPFPPSRDQHLAGAGLQRWSAYALLAAGLGGLGGILLGSMVAVVAWVRLLGFSQRVRGWRPGAGRPQMLPVAASEERLRLLGAVSQGLLAALLGAVVLALIVWHLW
jgi:hypothetical protein